MHSREDSSLLSSPFPIPPSIPPCEPSPPRPPTNRPQPSQRTPAQAPSLSGTRGAAVGRDSRDAPLPTHTPTHTHTHTLTLSRPAHVCAPSQLCFCIANTGYRACCMAALCGVVG